MSRQSEQAQFFEQLKSNIDNYWAGQQFETKKLYDLFILQSVDKLKKAALNASEKYGAGETSCNLYVNSPLLEYLREKGDKWVAIDLIRNGLPSSILERVTFVFDNQYGLHDCVLVCLKWYDVTLDTE